MTTSDRDISVIIPTHNRRASVSRTLRALESQTVGVAKFEVIVVADGCTDDTVAVLRGLSFPYQCTVIEQEGQGQGKARNAGAAVATGRFLVFLDDDIEPSPSMLAEYLAAHESNPRALLLGPALPVLPEESSLFSQGLRNWWIDHFQELRREPHRFTYRDMLSGNFSMSRSLFDEATGFDPAFFGRSGEDYEFGIRLLRMGVPYVFVADAAGLHHDATTFTRSLTRVRMEGRADVLIGVRHPELRSSLPLTSCLTTRSRWSRALQHLAFHWPWIGEVAARFLQSLLAPLEHLRFRRSWRKVHGAVRTFWYCLGVAEELRQSAGSTSLAAFLAQPGPTSELIDVHLDHGLEHAQGIVDRLRPSGVRVLLNGMQIGTISAHPGAEPIRGVHLVPVVIDGFYAALHALAAQRITGGSGLESPGSPFTQISRSVEGWAR